MPGLGPCGSPATLKLDNAHRLVLLQPIEVNIYNSATLYVSFLLATLTNQAMLAAAEPPYATYKTLQDRPCLAVAELFHRSVHHQLGIILQIQFHSTAASGVHLQDQNFL